ncbi:MAG: cob(I)yrinic acid a,c-diamide adenosyltransferase [Armatimonadota bacterium]
MRIYTRTGDQGETGLFGGQRVAKNHPRVEAYGEVDELNAALGICVAHCRDQHLSTVLERLQSELFIVGSDLATPLDEGDQVGKIPVQRVTEGMHAALEALIDEHEDGVPPLTTFILPGGTVLASFLHLARCICRRAERSVLAASGRETLNPEVLVYLNRLSDLLFTLARDANHRGGHEETPWLPQPGG